MHLPVAEYINATRFTVYMRTLVPEAGLQYSVVCNYISLPCTLCWSGYIISSSGFMWSIHSCLYSSMFMRVTQSQWSTLMGMGLNSSDRKPQQNIIKRVRRVFYSVLSYGIALQCCHVRVKTPQIIGNPIVCYQACRKVLKKTPHYPPVVSETTVNQCILSTKGRFCAKCFNALWSSWHSH